MAQQGGEYGRQTDEYGNPVQRPGGTQDKFGTTGGHGTGQTGATEACKTDQYGTTGATGACKTDQHGTTGAYGTRGGGGLATGTTGAGGGGHRRSGSSSSEDDGQGGRRKKGVKEKIKEKLPGGGHKDEQTHSTDAACGAGGYGREGERPEHEKKGMTEKIKEKLPGKR